MKRNGIVTILVGICVLIAGRTTVAQSAISPDTVAVVGGQAITASSLDQKAGSRLIAVDTQRYWLRRATLEELIGDLLLEKEAGSRRITVAALLRAEVEGRSVPVGRDEARAVFEAAKERFAGSEEASIALLVDSMNRQRLLKRRVAFLKELREKWHVRTTLTPPRATIGGTDGPAVGPLDAPVRIVEFTDFACPFCVKAQPTLKQVMAMYPGKVRLEFMDFPLTTLHPKAAKAAEAAACAADQAKFWEYHDRLFSSQRLDPSDLRQHAFELALDPKAFDECLTSARHESDWRRRRAIGESYGITGTPAFFINGRLVSGAAPLLQFTQVIDEELQSKTPTPGKANNGPGQDCPET